MSLDTVQIKELRDLENEQGGLQHMLRADDAEFFRGFGEIYFSIVNPGVVKGWHRHLEQTSVLSCVHGDVLLVVHADGQFRSIRFGDGHRRLVLIPPGIVYGWKNLGTQPAILANCATHVHDPVKSEKLGLDTIPFDWPN